MNQPYLTYKFLSAIETTLDNSTVFRPKSEDIFSALNCVTISVPFSKLFFVRLNLSNASDKIVFNL